MSILKWICKNFSCKSNCTFNEHEDHINTFASLQDDLHLHYNLCFDDVKKIEKILKKKIPKKCTKI